MPSELHTTKLAKTVIDGPLPPGIWEHGDMEPHLVTAPEHMAVLHELMQREPLFHRSEFGTTRKDFEKMTAPDFWEVGDFHCLEIAADNYLATYTLIQGERITRRAAIWRRTVDGWQIVYHQGTIVVSSYCQS